MILILALAILSLIGVMGAIVASVHDSRSPVRTVWGYDTRRPLL
jgi:hypothetical protein